MNWIVIVAALAFLALILYFQARLVGADPLPPTSDDRLIIDARSPQEFAGGHIAGALNIPHTQVQRMADEIGDKQRQVIVYCLSGARSGMAVRQLRKMGFSGILNGGALSQLAGKLDD